VLAALLFTAACGDDDSTPATDAPTGEIDAPSGGPRETVTRSVTLNAGASKEAEVRLNAAGDKVHVRIMTPVASLAWNVHTHNAGETQTLIEESAVDLVDYEISGIPNDYWVLLVNGSNRMTFDVNLDLYGEATYTGGL
jgi:hypothetical protein